MAVSVKILNITTIFSTDNYNKKKFSWAPNQHIGMVSEGACDSEAKTWVLFLTVIFHKLLYFSSNTCNVFDHKRLLSKTFTKIFPTQT